MVAPSKRADWRRPDLRTSDPKQQGLGNRIRARWILAHVRKDPSITYAEQVGMIRDRFGGSYRRAEADLTLMRQILDEQLAKMDLSWVIDQYKLQIAEARRDRKHNAVRALLDSIARVTGNDAPIRIDVEHSGTVDVRAIAHLNILRLTPAQRANRERELVGKSDGVEVLRDVAPACDGHNGALAGVAPSSNGHGALADLGGDDGEEE